MSRPLVLALMLLCAGPALAQPTPSSASDAVIAFTPPRSTLGTLLSDPPAWPSSDCNVPERSRVLLFAQQGCCSSHNGVCGCSSAGKTQCCDGTQSPTCTCSPPPTTPTHTLTITAEPTGTPNPTTSGGAVQLSVTAADSLGHALSYAWSVLTCLTLPSDGAFNNVSSRTPVWTAPVNTSGIRRFCSLQVTVSDGQGLSRLGFVTQGVDPAPPPPAHTLTITAGPTGTPNPAASGSNVNLSVATVDSLGHALSYGWVASCQTLPANGTLNNAASSTPTWTAPTNATGSQQSCTIQVTVNDGNGLNRVGSFAQEVAPLPPAPPIGPPPTALSPTIEVIATGCTTCRPGGVVGYDAHISNPGAPMLVELKGGARLPDGTVLRLIDIEMTIPTGSTTVTIAPLQMLPAELSVMDLTVEAALLEPALGVTLSRHTMTLHLLP
jgi:hypothetical protein